MQNIMKLKSGTSFYLLFLITLFFVSCECVTKLDTQKVIEPTEFAHVMFINVIADVDSVDICSLDKIIERNLLYDSAYVDYIKIPSGLSSIRIQNFKDSAIHFNSMLELIKDNNYTFFAFGTKSRVNGLLINDSIENKILTNAYVRLIHLSQDAPEVDFAFDNLQMNQEVKYKSYTKFMPIPTGVFTLIINDINNGSELIKVTDYSFKPGKFYNLLLKGYYNQPNLRQLKCDIIEFAHQ